MNKMQRIIKCYLDLGFRNTSKSVHFKKGNNLNKYLCYNFNYENQQPFLKVALLLDIDKVKTYISCNKVVRFVKVHFFYQNTMYISCFYKETEKLLKTRIEQKIKFFINLRGSQRKPTIIS